MCQGEDYQVPVVDGSKDLAVQPYTLVTTLAGGKVDHFNIFCVDSSPRQHQQIFDHAINAQWTVFAASKSDLAIVKTDVMSHIIHTPVSYHVFLYAGACHRMYWKEGFNPSSERTTGLLILKNNAIRAMMEAVQPGFDNVSDEILIAMLLLAAHGSGETARRRKDNKVQSRKAQGRPYDNEFWCAMDTERPHMDMLAKMVRKRGVGNIRPGPLLNALCLQVILPVEFESLSNVLHHSFDVLDSYCEFRHPQIDSLAPFNFFLTLRTWPSDAIAQRRLERTTNGFSEIFACMGTSVASRNLQEVVHGLTLIEIDLEQVSRSTKDPKVISPHYATVLWIRSMCVRELLTLPENLTDGEYTAEESESVLLVYEMCRLSCLLVCQVWLHPDYSCKRNLARQMVNKLHPLLLRATKTTDPVKFCDELPDFFLWSLILGIVLAYEDFDKTGNMKGMFKLAPFLGSTKTKAETTVWPVISKSMEKFLWPVKQQEETGKEAWELVCQILTTS